MKIVFAGGGTGGHIYPIIAVARELRAVAAEKRIPLDLHYLGPIDQYSAVLAEEGIKMHSILTGKIRRYFSLMNIVDIPKFFIGFLQTFFKLLFLMPDIIFSKGGPGAFQVVFSGWVYRIPSVIHESDATPGLTNLLSSRFAKRICVSFEDALKYFNPSKTALTGNPIRPDFFSTYEPKNAKLELGFDKEKKLLLVIGGSQGSKTINELILSILPELLAEIQVMHQTGTNNFEEINKLSKIVIGENQQSNRYQAEAYLDYKKVILAIRSADLVIARAGSGTIFELAAAGKPSILIPLAGAANDHQRANAYAFSDKGATTVIEESNMTPQVLLSQIKQIINSKQELDSMAQNAFKFARPDAAKFIVAEILP